MFAAPMCSGGNHVVKRTYLSVTPKDLGLSDVDAVIRVFECECGMIHSNIIGGVARAEFCTRCKTNIRWVGNKGCRSCHNKQFCDLCGEEIKEGEAVFETESGTIHEECAFNQEEEMRMREEEYVSHSTDIDPWLKPRGDY